MFTEGVTHDFGSVPRGAQLSHQFKVTNIYAVPMEITEVKSGCGCVSAEAAKRVLQPRESTYVEVRMDTRRFTNAKTVRIRVSVGPQFISSAELLVSAVSRADIVFNPGEVNFGTVAAGQTPSQTLDIEYAGTYPWQITKVIAKDAPVDAKLEEWYRRPGQVGYHLHVTLKANAPAGALKKDLFLKTNDPNSPLVPVLVEGNIRSALVVSPNTLRLGNVPVGEELKRRVVLRGGKPFLITDLKGLGEGLSLDSPPATQPTIVQTLTFRCRQDTAGNFRHVVQIKTDLQPEAVAVVIEGSAVKQEHP
jgi:hypothetical protein